MARTSTRHATCPQQPDSYLVDSERNHFANTFHHRRSGIGNSLNFPSMKHGTNRVESKYWAKTLGSESIKVGSRKSRISHFGARVIMGFVWVIMGFLRVFYGFPKTWFWWNTGFVRVKYGILRVVYGKIMGFYGILLDFPLLPTEISEKNELK